MSYMDIKQIERDYLHELLDRTNLILDIFQTTIVEHEAVLKDCEAQEKCEEICEKIADLYQFFGQQL